MTLKQKFIEFLKQGLTPEKLALCVALGLMIGIIPVLGTTIALSFLVAWVLRLNQLAMQATHWAVYPVQLALVVPWFRAGERLFGEAHLKISIESIKGLYEIGLLHMVDVLWVTTLHALVVWLLVAPIAVGLMYAILLPLFRRLHLSTLIHHKVH